jgi:hypothetical protein
MKSVFDLFKSFIVTPAKAGVQYPENLDARLRGHDVDRKAYIVFSGETEIRWLRWILKPGFRHCFVLLNDGSSWLSVDSLAHYMEVAAYAHPRTCHGRAFQPDT